MKKQIQKIFLLGVSVFLCLFLTSSAQATEFFGNLETGLTTGMNVETENCSPLTVTNGTVADYPICTITCNPGYTLSGSTCVASGGSSGSSSSGTTSNITTYCTSITYGDWSPCVGGIQYRDVIGRSPTGCSLTTTQQLAANRTCEIAGIDDDETGDDAGAETGDDSSGTQTGSDLDIEGIVNREREMVKSVSSSLSKRLAGRILLQVEEHGQAWYVDPLKEEKHFMGRPVDAFSLMRRFGLGISEANFAKFEKDGVPSRFAGRIFLRVENNGEAYYVNPVDMEMHYLGRPEDAFRIMQELALGINNTNLRQIRVGD